MKLHATKAMDFPSERWGMHYHFAALIMEIAATKCEIYNRLRKAYLESDRAYLEKLVHVVLPQLAETYKEALAIRKELWFRVQKPFSFDKTVRDYGGCIADVEYTKDWRLMRFIEEKTEMNKPSWLQNAVFYNIYP